MRTTLNYKHVPSILDFRHELMVGSRMIISLPCGRYFCRISISDKWALRFFALLNRDVTNESSRNRFGRP